MTTDLEERLVAEITASGPMPFDVFVERALYDPEHGFYTSQGRAGGRRGDFVTSAEIGPLFGAVLGDWLDTQWHQAGRPTSFRVCEVGAGVGTLFRAVNRAKPACFDALRYTLVERSASMRVAHQALPSDRWRSVAEIPDERQHVIVANELLDNLAFSLAERVPGGWADVEVDVETDQLLLRPAAVTSALAHLSDYAPDAPVGVRVPVAGAADQWVRDAQQTADVVLVFDYAATTAELAARDQAGWLRTYAEHARGSNPLIQVGHRDITYDVPTDQLPVASQVQTQAEWLRSNGLPERVEAARALWAERGHIGDLEAVVARSAINEAEALTDPDGLGSFLAMEWHGR